MLVSAPTHGALLVLAQLGLSGLSAQVDATDLAHLTGGVVEGVVYDSTALRPLEGARVFLWNTSMFSTTDEGGRFVIEDVPAGDYSLVFFHPRLTALGVASGRTPVSVQGEERASVALSTPSMPTIMSLLCELEDPGQSAGRIVGRVGDASTGVPLPGAQVLFTWTEQTPEGRHTASRQTRADGDGWYSLCSVPSDVDLEGQAYFYGQQTNSRNFRLPSGNPSRLDFALGEVRASSITGLLRDADTNRPIADAQVTLPSAEIQVLTDGGGRFHLDEVPPGYYQMQTRHVAYGRREDAIQVDPGQDLVVELELAVTPIELAPMRVSVPSKAEAQALAVGGRLISRSQIDEVRTRSQDMGDVLSQSNTPGLVVSRGGTHVCVGFRRGQVTMQRQGGCVPAQVYINDVPTSDPTIALNLAPEVIDRVILVPPVEAGVLYSTGSSAGVILIYTRSR